jgi:hypothetical protein
MGHAERPELTLGGFRIPMALGPSGDYTLPNAGVKKYF